MKYAHLDILENIQAIIAEEIDDWYLSWKLRMVDRGGQHHLGVSKEQLKNRLCQEFEANFFDSKLVVYLLGIMKEQMFKSFYQNVDQSEEQLIEEFKKYIKYLKEDQEYQKYLREKGEKQDAN